MFVEFDLFTALWFVINAALAGTIAFIVGYYITKKRKTKKMKKTLDKQKKPW